MKVELTIQELDAIREALSVARAKIADELASYNQIPANLQNSGAIGDLEAKWLRYHNLLFVLGE